MHDTVMKNDSKTGRVILAAAGPGDPELITLKTLRYLQEADIVLTDRLVSPGILNCYVNARAEIIYVGKQCRDGHSTPQEHINELMVQYAMAGKLVVRLKGGDVSVFSNILDELQALTERGIRYEIIPGVTAALGAAAYSGIPLTARGVSTAVRLLTYYKSDIVSEDYWKELAATDDTLVFYMSAETLALAVNNLLKNNISPDKKLAVIAQATTSEQNVAIYDLKNYADAGYISPTIAIIGRVVALHRQFAWLSNNHSPKGYFKTVRSAVKSNDHAS